MGRRTSVAAIAALVALGLVVPAAAQFGWIFGDQNIDVKDTETWAKIDSDFMMHDDSWTDLKFGVRFEKHDRT